ncbi:hypothetical protein RFI_23882 [Reticulomyxa filosa]|uniref:Uncharacterized protein n=1 Tax=Reticulomyxa filosa TaxID=46433 RepID=X6MI02_RETFI|nr:hypothetical protein RFI_23882 [Reticulomyxa filosa]|eukprot:ETO13489.1 hypothetical protein RFI_23882 [Reticulomyxa filosa]
MNAYHLAQIGKCKNCLPVLKRTIDQLYSNKISGNTGVGGGTEEEEEEEAAIVRETETEIEKDTNKGSNEEEDKTREHDQNEKKDAMSFDESSDGHTHHCIVLFGII